MRADLRLYVLVDAGRSGGHDRPALAAAAAAGGATLIQVRNKAAGTRAFVEEVRAIQAALAGSGVPLLVNDRVDVALAAGADGVHLGQDDMAAPDARTLMGAGVLIGLSVTRPEHAAALAGAPVDYACIGAVFATGSKADAERPMGLSGLAALRREAHAVRPDLPVGAIAGIDASNAAGVIAAGADGIAVISAVSLAPDPAGAARVLRELVDGALAARGHLP